MKIAAIQLGYDDAEPKAERIERAAELVAAQAGHDLVVLPELWGPTGFDYTRWADEAEDLAGPTVTAMADAARKIKAVVHAGSIVERLPAAGPDGNDLANTSILLSPAGEMLATYRKIHRFGFGAGEPKLMEAGSEIVLASLPPAGSATSKDPAGSPDEVERVAAGLSTCYDLRFAELYRAQVERGAQLFLVPAAWPAPRVSHWSLLGRARAVENQSFLVAVNTAGTHAGHAMGGRSQIVSPRGAVLAEAGTGEEVLSVELDLSEVTTYRAEFPVLADRRF